MYDKSKIIMKVGNPNNNKEGIVLNQSVSKLALSATFFKIFSGCYLMSFKISPAFAEDVNF